MIQSRAIGLVMAPSLSPLSRFWFFPYGAQNLTVIDLHTALRGYGDLFLDGVHPGLEGNRVIATIIYDVLAKEYSLNK